MFSKINKIKIKEDFTKNYIRIAVYIMEKKKHSKYIGTNCDYGAVYGRFGSSATQRLQTFVFVTFVSTYIY